MHRLPHEAPGAWADGSSYASLMADAALGSTGHPPGEFSGELVSSQADFEAKFGPGDSVFLLFGQRFISPPPRTVEELAAALRAFGRRMNLAENWTWPERRDPRAPVGPEPTRAAFRDFLDGGHPYHEEE